MEDGTNWLYLEGALTAVQNKETFPLLYLCALKFDARNQNRQIQSRKDQMNVSDVVKGHCVTDQHPIKS